MVGKVLTYKVLHTMADLNLISKTPYGLPSRSDL